MRVSVDQEQCCASGQCALTVPEVFDQRDEDGVAILLDADPPERLRAEVSDAAAHCPSRAITVES